MSSSKLLFSLGLILATRAVATRKKTIKKKEITSNEKNKTNEITSNVKNKTNEITTETKEITTETKEITTETKETTRERDHSNIIYISCTTSPSELKSGKIANWIESLECLYPYIEKIHVNLPQKYKDLVPYDEDEIKSLETKFPLIMDVNRSIADYGLVHGFLNTLIKSSQHGFIFTSLAFFKENLGDNNHNQKKILFLCLQKMEEFPEADVVVFEDTFYLLRCLRLRFESSRFFDLSLKSKEIKGNEKDLFKEIMHQVVQERGGKVISLRKK